MRIFLEIGCPTNGKRRGKGVSSYMYQLTHGRTCNPAFPSPGSTAMMPISSPN
jgi:hypothetical protein